MKKSKHAKKGYHVRWERVTACLAGVIVVMAASFMIYVNSSTNAMALSAETETPRVVQVNDAGPKGYVDFRTLGNTPVQKALWERKEVDEDGFVQDDEGHYLIALDSQYGFQEGQYVEVVLTGFTFSAVVADISERGDGLAFIVDSKKISDECIAHKDMSYSGFNFKVVSIEAVEGRTVPIWD